MLAKYLTIAPTSLSHGKIYWWSTDVYLQGDDLPEDLDDPARYLAVPSQRELGLGRQLALVFAADEIPADYDRVTVGRKRVRRLMRRMGLAAIYQQPRTRMPHPGAPDVSVSAAGAWRSTRPNQVWCADISVPRQAA